MMPVSIIGIIVVLIILDYIVKIKKRRSIVNIHGPRIYPIIGCSLFFTQKNKHDLIVSIIESAKKFGSTVVFCGGYQMTVVTIDSKFVQQIFNSPKVINKHSGYKMAGPWLEDGLIMSSGQKWQQRRKIITPTFSFSMLEQFVEVFDQQSKILVDKLRPNATGASFDISSFIKAAALDAIAETAMNVKLNSQSGQSASYVHASEEMCEILMSRISNIFYQNALAFRILAPSLVSRQEKALAVLHDFTRKIIQERRKTLLLEQSNGLKDDHIIDHTKTKRRMVFLDVLLQSTIDGKPLNDSAIHEEVDVFVIAGHDTVASAVSFCLYHISRHPHVQAKLYDEIRQVFSEDLELLTLNKLNKLKYMELVIKESLRLCPPGPAIGRSVSEDIVINNKKISAGTNIIIPIFAIQKNPEIFPDPESFVPERHLSENIVDKSLYTSAYMPFSAGLRNCIGQKFAMFEMKCMISEVLKNFEVLPLGEEPMLEANIVLKSLNGVQMGMKLRKCWKYTVECGDLIY